MVYNTDMEKSELLFAEFFKSLFSLDDILRIAQSVIIYFYSMSISYINDVFG